MAEERPKPDCRCPWCKKTRKRVYSIVYNWKHKQKQMVDRLTVLVRKIRDETQQAQQ